MNTAMLFQITGLAAILSGASTLFSYWLIEGRKEKYPFLAWWVYTANAFFMVLAFLGIHLFQEEGSGLWGLAAFLFALTGNMFTTYTGKIAGMNANQLGRGLIALAIISISVGTWQAMVFPVWVPALWLATIILGVPGMFLKSWRVLSYILGGVPFSLGLIAAGYFMLSNPTL